MFELEVHFEDGFWILIKDTFVLLFGFDEFGVVEILLVELDNDGFEVL